ncbi:MAG: ester cyclase [Anaerolineae bacterium]
MPIITVQFIKDVVATPEQKKQLIVELTNTFVGILGDVVRPFVYTIIQETPQQEWGIAGVPMPDLVYLTSDKHAQVIGRSNDLMRGAIAQMAAAQADAAASKDEQADAIWRGTAASANGANGSAARADADRRYWERWFDELWNKKNYDIVYEYVDDNFTAHGAGGQQIKMGPNGPKDMVKAWHAAMPDGRMTIDDIITEGDLSTIRMTWRATHTGKFGDIPPSGKKIEVTSIGIDRVVDGKITEGWGELNMLGMLQQMGAIPAPSN